MTYFPLFKRFSTVCSVVDNRFLCGNGTIFDQESLTCNDAGSVNCLLSENFHHRNSHLESPGGSFPKTSFSCSDKTIGGLYADVEAGCVMYHICTLGVDGRLVSLTIIDISVFFFKLVHIRWYGNNWNCFDNFKISSFLMKTG